MSVRKTRRYLPCPAEEDVRALLLRHHRPTWMFNAALSWFQSVVEVWNGDDGDASDPGPKGGRPSRTWIRALASKLHEAWVENGGKPGLWEQGVGPPSAELAFLVDACKLLDPAVSPKTVLRELNQLHESMFRVPIRVSKSKRKGSED